MVKLFCQGCLECTLQRAVYHRKDVITSHLTAEKPRLSWSLDCAPRLGASQNRRLTIVVGVDDFSKFVVLTAVEDLSSKSARDWFLQEVVAKFGKPR